MDNDVLAGSVNAIAKAAGELGLNFWWTHRDRVQNRIHPMPEDASTRPVIVYGSIQWCKAIDVPVFPGAYGFHGTDWITMSNHVPRNWLVNETYVLTSWGDLKRNFFFWQNMHGTKELHVRPVSDKKTFAGQIVEEKNLQDIEIISSVVDSTLIVVSPLRPSISSEIRYFVAERQIVGRSANIETFLKFGLLTEESLSEMEKLAKKITALEWQPDTCYSFDLLWCDLGPRLVEMNSFATAGLYSADAVAILKAVADSALREFNAP